MISFKHKLVSTFEPENILIHFKDKTIIHDSEDSALVILHCKVSSEFFFFFLSFFYFINSSNEMHKREIFKNRNFL